MVDVGGNTIFLAGGSKTAGPGPGAGDGTILTGSTQTWESDIVLSTDYLITSTGLGIPADDAIAFNGLIDGPGGLAVGSTPSFNNFIGSVTPLSYLFLNSALSNFNMSDFSEDGAYTATIQGSFVNAGTMVLGAVPVGGTTNYTFITDNGVVGPGPGVFSGGTMDLNGNTITIYAATPEAVTGSAVPFLQTFNAWNGGASGPPVFFAPFAANAIFFKSPPPPEEPFERERLYKRKYDKKYEIAYAGPRYQAARYAMAGMPDVGQQRVGGLVVSTYDVMLEAEPERVESTYFTDHLVQPQ
ncbi:MAG: hypothetical protein HC888_13085 [Candidatus Competibacteraceae bacterium]|nr:hypothetical protein [Candidatus Competibacteraceae bacterium]